MQWGVPLDRVLAVRMVAAFDTRLHDLGWENGRNIRVEHRGSDGTLGQLQTAAAQVVASQPDVIVVGGTVSAVAMSKARSPTFGCDAGHASMPATPWARSIISITFI